MESNTAKNFALQLGALISLYISLSTLLVVLFGIINISFPDALDTVYSYESAQSGIRFGIAMIIVFFPTYVVLTRFVNNIRRKEHGAYLVLTKWLIYLSLLVGGAVILGDLVAVLNAFLNGEITTRFVLKALAVLVVVGAAFYYYILDAKAYWNTHEKLSIRYGAGAIVVVFVTLVLGYMNIDTPQVVRETRLDTQQVADLQDMQYRIEDYYRSQGRLPETLQQLYTGNTMPSAPEGRTDYVYEKIGDNAFSLCATFAYASDQSTFDRSIAMPVTEKFALSYNWDHEAGEFCFERTIQNTAE